MTMKRLLLGFLGATMLVSVRSAQAQETDVSIEELTEIVTSESSITDKKKELNKRITAQSIDVDFDVPASPAFVALGLTPDSVIKPGTLRNLSAGVLNGTDENGNLQTGFAVDFLPYLTLLDGSMTMQQFRDLESYEKTLAQTEMTVAIAKGLEDDESLRLALGLRSNLIGSDPRDDLTYVDCIVTALKSSSGGFSENVLGRLEGVGAEQIQNDRADLLAGLEKDYKPTADQISKAAKKCLEDFENKNSDAFKLDLGVASTLTAPEGGLGDLNYGGTAIWTSASFGFGSDDVNLADLSQIGGVLRNSKVIFHTRYRTDELRTDEVTSKTFSQNQFLAGGKIRLGSNSLHLDLEGAYVHEDKKDGFEDDSYAKFTANLGFRIADDTWFAVTVGSTEGKQNNDSIFALGNLKYAFTTRQPFGK